MIYLDLDDGLSVSVERGSVKRYAYGVLIEGEEVVAYETSADVRDPAGRMGVRNVVARHASGLGKAEIAQLLDSALIEHEDEIRRMLESPPSESNP